MSESKIKKFTIVMLSVTILIMCLAYSRKFQQLQIDGNATVTKAWNIEITDIKEGKIVGKARSEKVPTRTSLTATFNTVLSDYNDSIEYIVTIKNSGEIDAKISNIIITQDNELFNYEVLNVFEGQPFNAGTTKDVIIRVSINQKEYDATNQVNSSSFSVVFNCVQNV